MVKLNLGCGDRKMHGFVNVDSREDVSPDVVADVTQIHTVFKDVDMIYACHVLEHFPTAPFPFQPTTWKEVLTSWYRALKPGGLLRISVPDLMAVCEYIIDTADVDSVKCLLYGGQKYDFDFHYHGWTFESLKKELEKTGFKKISSYDWRATEHYYIDDYSQSYLPHMDKISGKLMSLNVEAIK